MRKSRNLDDVEVNMTPMIDVVFLLIIFFMIVIDLSQQELENITLPRASECSEDKEPPEHRKIVNLKTDGTVVIKRQDMNEDQLRNNLRNWRDSGLFENDPDGFCSKPILIRTDRGTEMKHAQKVMEICGESDLKIWMVQLAVSQDTPGFHAFEDPKEVVHLPDED